MIPSSGPTDVRRIRAVPSPAKQLDRLVLEEVLGVVGVVAVDVGAEVDLAEGLLHRLAHLPHDDLGQRLAPLGVELGDLLDQRGALGDGGLQRPVPVGLIRRRDRRREVLVGDLRVLLDRLAGGRVDDCVLAHLAPLLMPGRQGASC